LITTKSIVNQIHELQMTDYSLIVLWIANTKIW